MDAAPSSSPLLRWSVATHTLAGQRVSGDGHLVTSFSKGVLVAVVDGLGHGEDAVTAANLAIATLREHAEESVVALVQRCHERLRGTRGVVMSLASVTAHDGLLTWLGVGDVEGVVFHAAPDAKLTCESLPLRGGVVGYQLPLVRPTVLAVKPADLLIFATDGLHTSFVQEPLLRNPLLRLAQNGPRQLADHLLAHYGKATDDALVLVARYVGEGS
jgi:serine/threonine protein phosphatase PrpC